MYFQKRKTLEDRINQVIHQMMSLPEERVVVSIHLGEDDSELPMENVRSKRGEILDAEAHGSLENKPRTEIRGTLISLYESLFLLEKEQQEKHDEARFKQLLYNESLNLDSLIKMQESFIDALVSEKEQHRYRSSHLEENEAFKHVFYDEPDKLEHTERQITLYNRVVETSRTELKAISKRYPSEILQRWKLEFDLQREEERRQLQMTLN